MHTKNGSTACQLVAAALSLVIGSSALFADVDASAITQLQEAATGASLDQAPLADAWRAVADAGLDDLEQLLGSFDDASAVGQNWLSLALDRVLQRAADNGEAPPAALLASYVTNAGHGARGREMALELLREYDDDLAATTIDKLINDPVARLRRPAMDALLVRAEAAEDETEQLELYRRMFELALDEDHIIKSAVALRKLGHPQDHIRKFGFIMHWQILGPFDYNDGEGFETAYPPESLALSNYDGEGGIYSDREFDGKEGKVQWVEFVNTARNGVVDLNKALGKVFDVVGYGATVYESEIEQEVEMRLRQQNSCKLWLNGELVLSQPVGHTGNFFDQYTVPVTLRKGPNLIVVKSCQTPGPVEHPFLEAWQFCVRITDSTGNALLAANRPPTPELDPLPTAQADKPASEAADGESKSTDDIETAEPANETTKES